MPTVFGRSRAVYDIVRGGKHIDKLRKQWFECTVFLSHGVQFVVVVDAPDKLIKTFVANWVIERALHLRIEKRPQVFATVIKVFNMQRVAHKIYRLVDSLGFVVVGQLA